MFSNLGAAFIMIAAAAAVATENDAAQWTSPPGPDCDGAICEAPGDTMLLQRGIEMRERLRISPGFDPEYAAMHFKSTCPAVGAVIKNGDLVPDCSSGVCLIDKEMNRKAFLRAGMSVKTANETTDANFKSQACPTCPVTIDPFAMNSIDCGSESCKGGSPVDQPHEHFRSTGVRDGSAVNVTTYDWIENNCLGHEGATWFLSNAICFADSADCEREPCQPGPTGSAGMYERMLSNDIDDPKRPTVGDVVCSEVHSGPEACPSQLHGSIITMFQEFAHPSGPWGTLSRAEQRALWLEGEYPSSFSKRSPSSCMDQTGDEAGCADCLSEVDSSSPDAKLLAERYCRCMHSQELSEATLSASEKYQCICQNATNGACEVQIEPIDATTGHYNPPDPNTSRPLLFNATEFFLGQLAEIPAQMTAGAGTATRGLPGTGTVGARGDPHLRNVQGQRFDLMVPGVHVLLQIPRASRPEETLVRAEAEARALGGACADMYLQTLNITGKWATASSGSQSGLRFSASAPRTGSRAAGSNTGWITLGKVGLKVVWGHTSDGAEYLNIYARHLAQAGYPVGGLLGEDDHTKESTPPSLCKTSMAMADSKNVQNDQAPASITQAEAM